MMNIVIVIGNKSQINENDKVYELYKKYKIDLIIVTGGRVEKNTNILNHMKCINI